MAGGYQTAGESTRRGTNIWPDTGGGWMNGRGDDTQTMFIGYGHIVDFFTGFDWWKTNPHDELVNSGNYCLADPGNLYAVYLPHAGKLTVKLEPGTYRGEWFNANSGQRIPLTEDATGLIMDLARPAGRFRLGQYPRLGAIAPKTMMLGEILEHFAYRRRVILCWSEDYRSRQE